MNARLGWRGRAFRAFGAWSLAVCSGRLRARRYACALAVAALVTSATDVSGATRYDPRLRFRTLRTAHFTILFHQGEDRLATRLATIAEDVHAGLSARLEVTAERHTYVILVDQHDDANGWATPLPFNTIEITATAPTPSSPIGHTDDWLRLVFTHEYVHILHLDRSTGFFSGLRRVFGRAPVLFPNVFLPGWETEGLATFYETRETGLGRLRSGEFRLIVDAPARAGTLDSIDRATGALIDWPGGNAAYAYGARFHEYLAQRFGQARFSRLAAATAGRVPYLPGAAYKKVFGQTAPQLWRDFARQLSGVPQEGSDGRFRREVPPEGSAGRFRREVPPEGSAGRFRREVPPEGSAGRFRREVPPEGSAGRFRREVPPEGSAGRFRREVPPEGSGVRRLTTQGFVAAGPRWLADGSVLYTSRTPHAFPSLTIMPLNGPPSVLAPRYLGERASVSGDHVYFDQQELVRSVALQGDLYVVALSDRRVQRLTRGERAADPDASPDGRTLVHVVHEGGRSSLVLRSIEHSAHRVRLGERRSLRDDHETQYAAPRWSPDGRRIAAERRRLNQRPDLVVIDADTREVIARVSAADGRVGEPEWLADASRLILSWERPTAPFNLYEVTLAAAGEARALTDLPNGARSAAVAPDGQRIAFVGYTVDGYDLFSAPIVRGQPATGLDVELGPTSSLGAGTSGSTGPGPAGSAYSPASSLLPRFWMPVVETDEDRIEAGAGTMGLDVLGRHSYVSTVRWSDRARPDWDIAYAFDRWRPTIVVSASDDLTVWRDADYRETSLDAGVLLPFRTVRRRQRLYSAWHATREEDPDGTFARRAVRLAYEVATSRRYGYSISPQDGVLAGLTAEVTRRALGSDANAVTLTADVRAYPAVGGRHRVLAVRAAFAGSYGERDGRRVVGAGGSASPASTTAFGHDVIGLARGFATDDIVGYRAAVVNIDYRLPLRTVERGVGRLPLFVRQVHAAVFADAAHAWTRTFRAGDARTSIGLELASDIVLGHYLPLTIAGGVAFRNDPSDTREGAAAFWRVGYAF